MYLLPQEVEVWYIIPTIRKYLATELVKNHKFTLEKTGGIIGVSKAAVSQYLNKKRAGKLKVNKDMLNEIKKSADKIADNNELGLSEILKLVKIAKEKGFACEACKKYNKGILNICKGNHEI